ncbi:hypothetical protein [Nioella aestuarii]|uniref:hypothetical protein n=1 Tax=Nioella aestuarii TaxID=1662864 RepID=UPI003D7F6520
MAACFFGMKERSFVGFRADNGMALHWAILIGCVVLCGGGIGVGIICANPAIGQWGGVLSVGLSFVMLFLGRDTPMAVLEGSLAEADPSGKPVEASLSIAVDALKRADNEKGEDVRKVAMALMRLTDAKRLALTNLDTDRQVELKNIEDQALTSLPTPKKLAVQTAFDAMLARKIAEKNEIALRAHHDWVRKETVPLVAVSIGGTLVAGFGNVLVEMFLN